MSFAPTLLMHVADASSAGAVMTAYVTPAIRTLCILASLVCVFFLINGGYHYLTSAGSPDNLAHGKQVIRNALIGLVIVLAAATLTAILSHAYQSSSAASANTLPAIAAVQPEPVSNGLVDVVIKAITGVLNNIIQSVAQPFLNALSKFTESTQLMADNASVFNLWRVMVVIANALFVIVLALLGFHVMSATTFGFDEIEFKHLLPRIGLIFLGINSSIFLIDGIISLSNVMIKAVGAAGGSSSVWTALTEVVKDTGGQGIAALLIMVAFLIFAVILLVYYIGRLVTLYIGAVLSPLLLLAWLIPGFRDFSESAAKTYLTTIFVLFVHVVILQLAASLFTGMNAGGASNTLMAMVVGLATLIALLKTQGVMMQFSYVSMGSRNARKLGGQFMNGVSYMSMKGRSTIASVKNRGAEPEAATIGKKATRSGGSYKQPRSGNNTTTKSGPKAKTGTTTVAPKVNTNSVKDQLREKP